MFRLSPSVLVGYWLFPVLMASHFTGRQRHRWPGHLMATVCDCHDCCVVSVSSSASFPSIATFLAHTPSVHFLCILVSTVWSAALSNGTCPGKRDASYFHSNLMWRLLGQQLERVCQAGSKGNKSFLVFQVQEEANVHRWKRAVSEKG